tara:strand:+ start:282 stop:668 length:387 start_codon:yes stop_codon:yes gene_type:complete
MNERELQAIVQKYSQNFEMLLENNSFAIDETKIFQTENPITEPTTRGGVYFAEMKELKVEAIVQDTSISKHLSKAMLGPNKEFLDIVLQASIDNKQTMSLVTNLTNIMQNASKIHLYLTLKDAIIESQ